MKKGVFFIVLAFLCPSVFAGMRADIDSSGVVDANDLRILSVQWLGFCSESRGDVGPGGGDGNVDLLDLSIVQNQWLWEGAFYALDGDLDSDGFVNEEDLAILAGQWLGEPADFCADIAPAGGDGVIDFLDYSLLSRYWQLSEPVGDDMVYIPGGEFEMGDHLDGIDDAPVHSVYVDSYYICRYEVTYGEYCDFLNAGLLAGALYFDPSDNSVRGTVNNKRYCSTTFSDPASQINYDEFAEEFSVAAKSGRDMSNDPIVLVSWQGAIAYCNWLSAEQGYELCYDLSGEGFDPNAIGYRLPTEAEWEYAAQCRQYDPYRRFGWGDTIDHSYANYRSDEVFDYDVSLTRGYHPNWSGAEVDEPYTSPVGSFESNDYGLYDMVGNVLEWCNDFYGDDYYLVSPYENPQGPSVSYPPLNYRVLRGGAWNKTADSCRVSSRYAMNQDQRVTYSGFRVVLSLH